jgi:hypothetical protein
MERTHIRICYCIDHVSVTVDHSAVRCIVRKKAAGKRCMEWSCLYCPTCLGDESEYVNYGAGQDWGRHRSIGQMIQCPRCERTTGFSRIIVHLVRCGTQRELCRLCREPLARDPGILCHWGWDLEYHSYIWIAQKDGTDLVSLRRQTRRT